MRVIGCISDCHVRVPGDGRALQGLLHGVSQQQTESARRAAVRNYRSAHRTHTCQTVLNFKLSAFNCPHTNYFRLIGHSFAWHPNKQVYGLSAAGDVAVPGLVQELQAATAACGPEFAGKVVPAIAHALGEATRTPASCATAAHALIETMTSVEQRLIERVDLYEEDSSGVDRQASKLRFALAASIQALGCVAERVVSTDLVGKEQEELQPLAEQICGTLQSSIPTPM